ncbi:unnamed protein product [Ectocarpus sp. 12 AP-2014]
MIAVQVLLVGVVLADVLGKSAFAISDVGLRALHPICDPFGPSGCTSSDDEIQQHVVATLEADALVTVVGGVVELGELQCDGLDEAPDAPQLQFAVSSNQTVIAERTLFSVTDKSVFSDNQERKVWQGDVVDPAPASGFPPSTIRITWTDSCDVEAFLLKMVSHKPSGTASVFKSVPCAAGASNEVCMVELDVTFKPRVRTNPTTRKRALRRSGRFADKGSKGLEGGNTRGTANAFTRKTAEAHAGGRKLQDSTQVDVMFLYTAQTVEDTTVAQMETLLNSELAVVNQGNINSEINLVYTPVYVGQLPYEEGLQSTPAIENMVRSTEVSVLRNTYGADLVHLFGNWSNVCGEADLFTGQDIDGFGVTSTEDSCLDEFTLGHEFGHNFGCQHDEETVRNDSSFDPDNDLLYNGLRYCDGDDPWITIMAYPDDCDVGYVNYFSNPDVMLRGKPTGTATANCAGAIKANMDAIADFRTVGTCASSGESCTSLECCDSVCEDGVCGTCVNSTLCKYPDCEASGGNDEVGDGWCDEVNNIEECGYDDGDCCICDCLAGSFATECGSSGYECLDPASACHYPDCAASGGVVEYIPDGFCNSENNTEECGYDGGDCCECNCISGFSDDCGSNGYDCQDTTSECTACTNDDDCDAGMNEVCCPDTNVCEVRDTTTGACGDPHMTGFRGQKFDFTGQDGGWYSVLSDMPRIHLNMRVTSPVPSVPEITYITGLGIATTDADGLDHTIVITVTDPHSLDSACPVGVSPCLADGALTVQLDGKDALLAPGEVLLGPQVAISTVNLPGACRSFGFEEYWERKKKEYARGGRRLSASTQMQAMSDWILGDPTATNMAECTEYVVEATRNGLGGLLEHDSEHTSFQILTPMGTIRLSHGRLHQLPMRDPTDSFDLPDHLTWQMNLAIDRIDVSPNATGILGETQKPTLDANGSPIMQGMASIRGAQDDYLVEGPLDSVFTAAHIHI